MKLDKYKIRLISGFVIIIVLSIAVYITQSYVDTSKKEANNQYYKNEYENDVKRNGGFIEISQINHTEEIQEIKSDNKKLILKEDFFKLIDNGMKNNSTVNCFIYLRELFESKEVQPVFVSKEYKDIIDYLEIQEFKDDKYIIYTLANTEEYMWGYFYNSSNKKENNTYFILDKMTGKLENLSNDLRQVIIY